MLGLSITAFALLLCPAGASPASTAEVSGRITISKKLTKTRVSLDYELRGVAVARRDAPGQTDLNEMNRIVVYLDGKTLPNGPVVAELVQKGRGIREPVPSSRPRF